MNEHKYHFGAQIVAVGSAGNGLVTAEENYRLPLSYSVNPNTHLGGTSMSTVPFQTNQQTNKPLIGLTLGFFPLLKFVTCSLPLL